MKKILFVCTGNTCRSPMAQALAQFKAKQKGITAAFASAGLYASEEDTSRNAIVALGLMGIDFCKCSEQLTQRLCDDADIIFGITASHAENIKKAFPKSAKKVKKFPLDIPDPYGGDIEVYRKCLEQISMGVDKILDALQSGEENEL